MNVCYNWLNHPMRYRTLPTVMAICTLASGSFIGIATIYVAMHKSSSLVILRNITSSSLLASLYWVFEKPAALTVRAYHTENHYKPEQNSNASMCVCVYECVCAQPNQKWLTTARALKSTSYLPAMSICNSIFVSLVIIL